MQSFIYQFVDLFFTLYWIGLIIYILSSWFPNLRESPFGEFLGKFMEPLLSPFRKIIPPLGMIDISPIVALFALNIAHRGALSLLDMIFGVV